MFMTLRIVGWLFFPLVLLYTLLVFLRNKLYDWKILKSCRVAAPVISVGNVQIGGTGKTPLVEWLALKIIETGRMPVVLTRGYGRKNKQPLLISGRDAGSLSADQAGDEPVSLAANLPDGLIAVDADRCSMAEKVLQAYSGVVFLLDDGFQHRRMGRNLDIVLLDVSRWSFLPLLFPLTFFRDTPGSLERAGAVVLSRNLKEPSFSARLAEHITRKWHIPVFTMETCPLYLQNIATADQQPLTSLAGKRVAAFAGVGAPQQFFGTIKELGSKLVWCRAFRDHQKYGEKHLQMIRRQAKQEKADLIITTQKDAVKLSGLLRPGDPDIYFLKITVDITPQQPFLDLLNNCLKTRMVQK
ncbi:MAG: tetraacyldisaccharide 4'-kinase [Calditrichia bacterium]